MGRRTTDTYKEVKNFIHNDLGISKSNIESIIERTVQTEVKKYMNDKSNLQQMIEETFSEEIQKVYGNKWSNSMRDVKDNIREIINNQITDLITKELDIQVKVKDGVK